MGHFTPEQQQFLDEFREKVDEAEDAQFYELATYCDNKFQFAKTYRVYREDLARTNAQIREHARRGSMGPGVTPEIAEEMIRIGTNAVEHKLALCEALFQRTWHEPITNYSGSGQGCVGVLVGMLASIAVIVALLSRFAP